jgi:hypothetical protein
VTAENPVILDGQEAAQASSESSSSETLNSSSSTDVDASVLEGEEIVVDMQSANKIRRTFPLRKRGADPAQCLDMLDDMYEIYYTQEVRLSHHSCGVCVELASVQR